MDKIRVSLVQYNIAWRSKAENFAKVESLLQGIETDVVILPEMFQTGFAVREPQEAEEMGGESIRFMERMAKEHQVVIIGTIMCREEGKLFNRMMAIAPNGMIGQYDKQHLFGLSHEHEHFSPGNEKVDIDIKGWKCRLIICYDLRFPYLSYNDSAYDALLISANWPVLRIAHWDALLQARAVENQCYVAAVNRVGMDPFGVSYPGHSASFDPAGELQLRFTGEGVRTVEWVKEVLAEYRAKLPFLGDQRTAE